MGPAGVKIIIIFRMSFVYIRVLMSSDLIHWTDLYYQVTHDV